MHQNSLTPEAFVRLFKSFHGRMPNGEKCHYCPEWDDMPIDSACKEFESCLCKFPEVQK